MERINMADLTDAMAVIAHPMGAMPEDLDPLMDMIGNAQIVLMGEATHGTQEFYRERARITKRLIEEKQFTAVAVEADWPDAYRANRFVMGEGDLLEGADPLLGFERFPQWMWRNTEVLDFLIWLRQRNDVAGRDVSKAGFYGLDLYSLFSSIEAVIQYLDRVDPEAAQGARERYACFDNSAEDAQRYGYGAALGLSRTCEDEVVRQLVDLQRRESEYEERYRRDEKSAIDDFFYAQQNAKLVKDAEKYYRSMFDGRVSSWNIRDRHMADTLDALVRHLQKQGSPAKIIVWEHNSHIGDARATQFGDWGEVNVGQLMREAYREKAFLLGFTTYTGTVMAASDWGAAAEKKRIRPALTGSYEALFHDMGLESFLLDLKIENQVIRELGERRLERAIGVIYRPETERASHYFEADLSRQFDAVFHIDVTRALEPLDAAAPEHRSADAPETFPSSL